MKYTHLDMTTSVAQMFGIRRKTHEHVLHGV
jgi:hypothetical protein